MNQVFREVCKVIVVWVQNRLFNEKRDGSHPLFQFFVLVVVGGCYD